MFDEIEFRNKGRELFELHGDAKDDFSVPYEDREPLIYYRKLQPLFNSIKIDEEVTLELIKLECIKQNPRHREFLNKILREGLITNPYVLSQYLMMIALFKSFGASGSTSTRNQYGRKYPILYNEIKTLDTRDFIRLNYIINTVKII
ncbi:hypothetical protein UT300012_22130 [Paraclostridium bifermentans]